MLPPYFIIELSISQRESFGLREPLVVQRPFFVSLANTMSAKPEPPVYIKIEPYEEACYSDVYPDSVEGIKSEAFADHKVKEIEIELDLLPDSVDPLGCSQIKEEVEERSPLCADHGVNEDLEIKPIEIQPILQGPSHQHREPTQCQRNTHKLTPHAHTSAQLKLHLRCQHCSKGFNSEDGLNSHLLSHKNVFICADCSKSFKTKGDLSRHVLTHKKVKPFSCGKCNKSFNYLSSLSRHMLNQHGVRPRLSCSVCNTTFNKKSALSEHLATHGERPFSCKQCTFRSKYKSDLASHMLIHSKKKTFSCRQCNSHFAQKSNLSKHISVVHKQIKPFSCSQCDKSFVHKCKLSQHMLAHSKEKHFSCSQCGNEFKQKANLSRHLATRCGQKQKRTQSVQNRYSCNQCGRIFIYYTNLYKHMKSQSHM